MDEARYRLLTLIFVGVTAVFAAALFALALVPYVRGLPVPSYFTVLLLGLILFSGILGWFTFPTKRVGTYLARKRGDKRAPADLIHELLALIAAAKRIWTAEVSFVDSFAQTSLTILNDLNQQIGKVPPGASVFIQEANGVVAGWRTVNPVIDLLVRDMDGLATYGMKIDENTLIALLDSLDSLISAGSSTANALVQPVTNALNSGASLSTYGKQGWTTFSSRANRLSDDLVKLGEKTKTVTGFDMKVYIPPIRQL